MPWWAWTLVAWVVVPFVLLLCWLLYITYKEMDRSARLQWLVWESQFNQMEDPWR